MRTINLISRTVALIVVFTIGFATLGAFMFGGGYLAYTKISIDVLQELGVPINVEEQIDVDAAEVDVTALTIQNMVSEAILLSGLKDVVSIQYLTDRYGLKATAKLPSYVTQKYRDMPLVQLLTEETKQEFLDTTMVGDLYSYEKTENPDYNAELGEGNPYLWKDDKGRDLVGLSAIMASYSLSKILSISRDPSVMTKDLAIAEVLELEQVTGSPVFIFENGEYAEADTTLLSKPINIWVDSSGTAANGMIGSIAPFKITEVQSGIDALTVADITSLVSYSGKWYMWSYDSSGNRIILEERNDITTELADVTIASISNGGLSDEIMNVELNAVLGYTKGADGKWYDDGASVSGLMSALAPYKVGELDTKVSEVKVGEISGYTYDENQGVWLDENSKPATGILAAMADLTVDQVSDEKLLSAKIQAVSVADVMGYKKDANGDWCTSDSAGNLTPVTGVMSVIAGSPINGVSDAVDNAEMYKILGYTPKLDDAGNPVLDSNGNQIYLDDEGNEAHVLMQKIARTKFADIDTITDNLTIEDLIPEDKRSQGYISLIPEGTTLEELPEKVDEVFETKSVRQFIEADVVKFESEEKKQQVLNKFGAGSDYENVTIPDLLLIFANTP